MAPLPTLLDPLTGAPPARYVSALVSRVQEVSLRRQIADAMGMLRRLDTAADPEPATVRALSQSVQELQRQLAALRDREEA